MEAPSREEPTHREEALERRQAESVSWRTQPQFRRHVSVPIHHREPDSSLLLPFRLGVPEAAAFDSDESEVVGAPRVQVTLK